MCSSASFGTLLKSAYARPPARGADRPSSSAPGEPRPEPVFQLRETSDDTVTPTPEAPDRVARLMFFLAVALGALRFFRLGRWSLWIDEAFTLADYHHGLDDGQIGNPWGYLAIGRLIETLGLSSDEFALRLLPAACGWLTIVLTYWAFAPAAGKRPAAAAALVVAASTWHLFWSQSARFYTLALVPCLLGSGLLLRGLRAASPVKAVLGLALAGLAALFHPAAVLLLPALVVGTWLPILVGFERSRSARRTAGLLTAILLIASLAISPWALEILKQYEWNKAGGSTAHFVLTTGFYITPLLATGAAFGALWGLARRSSFALFAFGVTGALILEGALASLGVTVTAQYVFWVLPFVAVVACQPLTRRRTKSEVRKRAAAGTPDRRLHPAAAWGYLALLVLPGLANTGLYFFVRNGERSHWREAYEYVWNQRAPDDLIMGLAAPVGEYYLSPGRTLLRHPRQVGWFDSWRATAKLPQQWARQGRRTWYVIRPEWLKGFARDDREAIEKMLREECRLEKSFPLWVESRDLSLEVYSRD